MWRKGCMYWYCLMWVCTSLNTSNDCAINMSTDSSDYVTGVGRRHKEGSFVTPWLPVSDRLQLCYALRRFNQYVQA